MRPFFILITVIIILTGCSDNVKNEHNNKEGELEYKIVYSEQLEKDGTTTFLPDKMVSLFKDDKILISIKGGFGLYNLKYISRAAGDTCFTLFKLFDKKLYYPMDDKQTLFVFNELGRPEIKLFKDSIKMIAGFSCKKAVISFAKKGMREIDAYYTEEIGKKNPNKNTPFEKIPGVLMEFNFFYKNLSFNLTAQKFTAITVPESEFLIPGEYKETTEEEIESFIGTLLQ
jgi:GLPGLI family protein